MDNFHIDLVSIGDKHLRMALEMAFQGAAGGKTRHYAVKKLKRKTSYWKNNEGKSNETIGHSTGTYEDPDGIETLILYWHEDRNTLPLPYEMDLEKTFNFVKGWLETRTTGQEPDIDGDSEAGFRVFTESWGRVIDSYSFVGIQFAWAMYGK
jgi:hypothetical protein